MKEKSLALNFEAAQNFLEILDCKKQSQNISEDENKINCPEAS